MTAPQKLLLIKITSGNTRKLLTACKSCKLSPEQIVNQILARLAIIPKTDTLHIGG